MTRGILSAILASVLTAAVLSAQQAVTLTAPEATGTRTGWNVQLLHIEKQGAGWRIVVELVDNLGNVVRDEHTGASAATLLNALNTANLTTNSLLRRILLHVQSEAKIAAGSVTGTPE
jgi:hypothetical protein